MTTEQTPAERILSACNDLGLTLRTDFVPFSKSRNAANEHRSLNWRVTLERNGRDVLATDFSAGMAHCPAYKLSVRVAGGAHSLMRATAIEIETETGKRARSTSLSASGFMATSERIHPEAADIISSLVLDASVLDAGGFESWADEYGYDSDSRKAEAMYRAMLDDALKLRAAIGEAGLETLRAACEDY